MSLDEPPRLPPERDVSPMLRARVLHTAVASDSRRRRPRRIAAPLIAGLAAAAVLVAIVAGIQNSRQPLPPSGNGDGGEVTAPTTPTDSTGPEPRTVGDHEPVAVDIRRLTPDEILAARQLCKERLPANDAGRVMYARRMNSPVGHVDLVAYMNLDTQQRYFCTPYAVDRLDDRYAYLSTSDPVRAISRTRVQGRVDTGDPDTTTFVDGIWVVAASSIMSVEVRINVGGDVGRWHESERAGGVLFASSWRALTPDEAAGPVEIQYRAITTDLEPIRIPGLRPMTVIPAATPILELAPTL